MASPLKGRRMPRCIAVHGRTTQVDAWTPAKVLESLSPGFMHVGVHRPSGTENYLQKISGANSSADHSTIVAGLVPQQPS